MTATAGSGQPMTPPATAARPWAWRLALNHGWWDRDGKPTFHAHDVNDLAACRDYCGLAASIEQPNEGSYLCPDCMVIVRQQPQGRPARDTSQKTALAKAMSDAD